MIQSTAILGLRTRHKVISVGTGGWGWGWGGVGGGGGLLFSTRELEKGTESGQLPRNPQYQGHKPLPLPGRKIVYWSLKYLYNRLIL